MTVETSPMSVEAAEILLADGKVAEARAVFQALVNADPNSLPAVLGLGRVHLVSRQGRAAANVLHQARRRFNDDPAVLKALIEAHAQVLDTQPGHVQAAMMLWEVADAYGDMTTAREALIAALMIDPHAQKARWLVNRMLPRVYTSAVDIAAWRRRFSIGIKALAATTRPRTPDEAREPLRELIRVTNFGLPYQGRNDRDLQATWGTLSSRVMAAYMPDLAERPTPRPLEARDDRRLKIGYASAHFRKHTIGLLFNGWLRYADRKRFKVHMYLTGASRDANTDVMERWVDVSRDVRDAPIDAAARAIRADELDILVYTDLGMDPRSFLLAALPLAPVQCMSWGHPVTSGLPTMDWFLTSDAMEPADGQGHYTERLHRLPRLSIAYAPPARQEDRKGRQALGLPEDDVLYLCCQATQKYLPQHDRVFPAIARAVPRARFVFLERSRQFAANVQFRERVERAFRQVGMDPTHHVMMLPSQPWADFLCLHAACDVFLDSIGWSGGNTTLEALSRGLPPVTLPTRFMRGRHTYAMLKVMGLDELIATDIEDYVRIAVRLGRDATWRQHLRDEIDRRQDRLYNDVDAVRALERFYEQAHAEALARVNQGAPV